MRPGGQKTYVLLSGPSAAPGRAPGVAKRLCRLTMKYGRPPGLLSGQRRAYQVLFGVPLE